MGLTSRIAAALLFVVSSPGLVAHAGILPDIGPDRLPWMLCETVPVDDPAGYTVRLTKDYSRLFLAYSELFLRGGDLEDPRLLAGWTGEMVDNTNADVFDWQFYAPGFAFYYYFFMDLTLPDNKPKSHFQALMPEGRIEADLECY